MQERAIEFAFRRCALGWLLVAGTGRGVCWIGLGDDAADLEARLRAEFPWAPLRPGASRVAAWARALGERVAGRQLGLELPLDVRGSRFQRRVWQAIRAIPRGETRSYGELAAALGRPGAARAVASACAANPVALLVPCHRVVRTGGGPGGYRWGAERKRALLEREREGAGHRGGGVDRATLGPCLS